MDAAVIISVIQGCIFSSFLASLKKETMGRRKAIEMLSYCMVTVLREGEMLCLK